MESKREIKQTFNKVLRNQIPEVIRQSGNNIQVGTVISFDTLSRISVVKLKTTGQIINGAKVAKGISTLKVGDEVIMVSVDSKFSSRNYIVACFGGNFRDTTLTAE